MPTTDLNGYDGSVSLGTNFNARLKTFNARVTRQVSDVTGYPDTGMRRLLGIFDVQGSAGGTLYNDGTNTSPFPQGTAVTATASWSRSGGTILLGFAGKSTSSTAAQMSITAVISQVNFSSDVNGDAGVTFDFQNSGGNYPTLTWDETA
jgi:hypothetical protein